MTSPSPNPLREALQVQPPDAIVDWLNILVYGPAGAGKTYLAGTAEEHTDTAPVLFLDVEGGVTTIRSRKTIDVKPIRSMKEIEDIFNTIYKSIDKGKIYYKTIVIDSLTELADLDMKTIMRQAYSVNPEKVDVDVPSPREWGKTRNHIRSIVRAFRDLPCNVVFTSLEGSQQEEGQPMKFFPGFSGKLRTEVPGFMDIVGYLTANPNSGGEITRQLQLVGTRRVVAKDRTGVLGGESGILENPTIPKMFELIHSTSTTTTPKTESKES